MKIYSVSEARGLKAALGFTLIELMIVVAIIAILSAIAYPSYVTYITKSRRVAAEGCLSQYANYMERFYTSGLSYKADGTGAANPFSSSNNLDFDCASPTQTGTYYTYAPTSATSSAFVVQATPINAQLTRDTTCGALALNQAGARFANGAAVVAGSVCW